MAIKPHESESELLTKVAIGDQKAFAELFNWYYRPLSHSIIKLTESATLSQEIVQDAFVTVWLNRETLPEKKNFSGYLFIICRNLCFKTLKSLAKERKIQSSVTQHIQWETELDDLENPAEHYRGLILHVVSKLPAQQQKIYMLSRYDRLKYDEIAEKLGLSVETVKTQVYNAVKFIRKELSGETFSVVAFILTGIFTQK